jgi:SNF2 family DNA or RNA helicase
MSGRFLRFTVADEVGIGKTNEPGLLLNERKPRGIVNRTLIVVPQSAMGQWQQEMKTPFKALFHYQKHP